MQDGNYAESDEDREIQINLDEKLGEEDESTDSINPNSIIYEAIENIKKELSTNHISGKNKDIISKMKKFPLISLDNLSSFLINFVKKANLSLYNRRILFAAITPIHNIFLHVLNNSNYKGITNQSIQISLFSPPYEQNSLKKCVDYFIKVFDLIQSDSQQINDIFFIQHFEQIIGQLEQSNHDDFNQIKADINQNIQSLYKNFKKLRESQLSNNINNKQIQRCKVELKRIKIMLLPIFDTFPNLDQLKSDFLSYYNNFYSEFKNFELFYRVNLVISQFKENWDQPLFWFLPCQMAKVDSNVVFNSAMEYLQTFWMICDLNIINTKSDTTETDTTEENNNNEEEKSDSNEKNDFGGKSDTEKSDNNVENGSSETDNNEDPDDVRIKVFDILEVLSFENKLEPQNCTIIARSFMHIVNMYNSYFNVNTPLSATNFDIEDIKSIINIVSVLPYTMKDVVYFLNRFLRERIKLLKQHMYVYNRKSSKNTSNFTSLMESSNNSGFSQQILCNATFKELFVYIHSFVTFVQKAKEAPHLYSMIKDEVHRLIGYYSELLTKAQMLNDSRILTNEALQKAKKCSLDNCSSTNESENKKNEDQAGNNNNNNNENENEASNNSSCEKENNEVSVDLFRALKELAISTRRVLQTKFIKDDKRDFMERFYTFLKICCPYFQNLKEQQLQIDGKVDIVQMKQFLSDAFPLFDTHDIFRFDTVDLEDPQIKPASNESDENADRESESTLDILQSIDLNSVWSTENKELLFDKSFPSIREQARRLQIGVSDDWKSVFEFKSVYKTFCRLFIVRKPQLPLNENPNEFEKDVHNYFSVAADFFMDKEFNIKESSIPLPTIIESTRSLSIKWMFSNTTSFSKEVKNENNDEVKRIRIESPITDADRQHWDYSSLLFGISFFSIPHPIQTISVFIMMLSSREKLTEVEGRHLTSFKDLFNSFTENFNSDTIDNFCKNATTRGFIPLFEKDLDFFYDSDNQNNDQDSTMLFSSIKKHSVKDIINEIMDKKEKYLKLSSIMTMMNQKYFEKPDSYSRLFVEIAFYANILKSFKDTLEILKKYDLLSAPSSDPELGANYISSFNSTWPFSPGFLDLDMYKNDFPGFISSLHSSILRLSLLKPNYFNIRRTFDFYMSIALSTYTFCFSSLYQYQISGNATKQSQFMNSFETNDEYRFTWNRSNYGSAPKANQKKKSSEVFEDIFTFRNGNQLSENDSKNQQQCINEIQSHFHALSILYSNRCSDHPSTILCCEILSRSTNLIKLLETAGLSDFRILSTILSGLSEVSFAIICALNIKKEVERIVNATIYFASLFGIKLSKTQNIPFLLPVITSTPSTEGKKETSPSSPQISQQHSMQSSQLSSQTSQPQINNLSQHKKKKVHRIKANQSSHSIRRKNINSSINNILCLSDFPSISTSFERASPVFERMAELLPVEFPYSQYFHRARSYFNAIQESLNKIKVPTTNDQFASIIHQSNVRMEAFETQCTTHMKRIKMKLESIDKKFKKMQSMIESDYSCITQKIEDESIKSEQLDEDIANIKTELNRFRKKKQNSPGAASKRQRQERSSTGSLHRTNSFVPDVLNFNFNTNTSRGIKQKPIAKAQLILAQAQELQKQNNLIQVQLQKNEIELSILNSLNKSAQPQPPPNPSPMNDTSQMNDSSSSSSSVCDSASLNPSFSSSSSSFFEKESCINEVVEHILSNASDVFLPRQDGGAVFDQDEDEKSSSVLSKASILSIISDIKKWEEQQQNITTIDHNELCDRIELLAYSLISATKTKESEMVRLQTQLKSIKSTQKERLVRMRNALREIDLEEE